MKIIGIIVEYNPFHNGHLYQINTLRKNFEPDGIVVVMSGQFVQRGIPAIYDKWHRAKLALLGGVDLVLELPTYYATASAEDFAKGGVKTLIDTGIVTHLAFGSESEHLAALDEIASILYEQPIIFKETLARQLKTGMSYPKAREIALHDALPYLKAEQFDILNQSNTILAIEYLKALRFYNSTIKSVVIKRVGSAYYDMTTHTKFASATAIRQLIGKSYISDLPDDLIEDLKIMLPEPIFQSLLASDIAPSHMDSLNEMIQFQIRTHSVEEIAEYREVREGLENKIKSAGQHHFSYEELINYLKSKRYSRTHLQRMVLNLMLRIKPIKSEPGYIRILAANVTGQKMLKLMKKTAVKELVITPSKSLAILKSDPHWQLDCKATDVYMLTQKNKEGGIDYKTPPFIKKQMDNQTK